MTPERLEELKEFCEWEDIDLEEMPIFAGKATNAIKELIAEVERLEFKSQQLSKVSDKLLDIAEYYTKEIDYLRRKLCEDTP